MNHANRAPWLVMLCLAALLSAPMVRADVVTDWDQKTVEIIADAKLLTPPANRAIAIVQTAVYEAVNAVTKRYPTGSFSIEAAPGASVEAAVAAASRATLQQLVPSQQGAIDAAFQAALASIADGPSKADGITVGERAAAAVLAVRLDDGAASEEAYRPRTTAGVYVPTTIPVASQWPKRKPWLMTGPAQFRPGHPPALASKIWARDYNEIKAVGAKGSTSRTAEQTAIARFWEATGPAIYHGVVRSVATMPGREVTQNARLFAATTQATDDAMIAIMDAKYHYGFWRPITAIRNGDLDGNRATERDASWTPLIDTPMHPEYPCAHCIVAATIGTVLRAEVGRGPMPTLSTTSATAPGQTRSWASIDEFVHEVANGRIYDGVHFRTSTEVGAAMGAKIGELAVAKYLRSAP